MSRLYVTKQYSRVLLLLLTSMSTCAPDSRAGRGTSWPTGWRTPKPRQSKLRQRSPRASSCPHPNNHTNHKTLIIHLILTTHMRNARSSRRVHWHWRAIYIVLSSITRNWVAIYVTCTEYFLISILLIAIFFKYFCINRRPKYKNGELF